MAKPKNVDTLIYTDKGEVGQRSGVVIAPRDECTFVAGERCYPILLRRGRCHLRCGASMLVSIYGRDAMMGVYLCGVVE